jgi:phytoene/squalene synthetase
MTPTQKQLADHLGLTAGRISQLKKAGMPVDSREAAEAWLALNVNRDRPRDIDLPEDSLPLDMGPKARLQRAQEGERKHFALWQAAVARQPANTREIAELATSWREMRKGAAEAEKELGAFLLATKATINAAETIRAFRAFISSVVQDFSTYPWGDEARRVLQHQLQQMHELLKTTNETNS